MEHEPLESHHSRSRIIASVIWGFAASASLWSLISPESFLCNRLCSGRYVLLSALLIVIGLALSRAVARRWGDRTTRARRAWIGICFIMAAMLLAAIPVRLEISPWSRRGLLEVIAVGEKRPTAHSDEVWVEGVERADGSIVSVLDFANDGRWEIRDQSAVSYQEQPARFTWSGRTEGISYLLLKEHDWSGIAEVRWNGESRRLDLYAEKPGIRRVPLGEAVASGAATTVYKLAFFGTQSVAVGGLLLVASVFAARLRLRAAPLRSVSGATLIYAAPCLLAWSLALMAYWPGLLSSDSVDQWEQVLNRDFFDEHPAFHTMSIWLVTRIAISTATAIAAQVIVSSLATGWSIAQLRQLGAPRWLAWLTTLAMATSPVNAPMVCTLWKDIPFSVAMLVFTVLILRVVASQGKWLDRVVNCVGLGCCAALVTLYRHNGIAPAFGTLMALFLVCSAQWRRVAIALGTAVLAVFLVQGPIFHLCGVHPSRIQGWLWPVIHHIGAHVNAGTPMTSDERAILRRLRKVDDWPYNAYSVCPLLYDGNFDVSAAQEWRYPAARMAWRLDRQRPSVALRHLRAQSSLVWRIQQPPNSPFWATLGVLSGSDVVIMSPYPNRMGLEPRPILPGLSHRLARYVSMTQEPRFAWLFWRPALQLYVLLAAALMACWRYRSWTLMALTFPVVINSIIIATMTPVQDYRYQYGAYLAGLVLGPMLLLVKLPTKSDPEVSEFASQA